MSLIVKTYKLGRGLPAALRAAKPPRASRGGWRLVPETTEAAEAAVFCLLGGLMGLTLLGGLSLPLMGLPPAPYFEKMPTVKLAIFWCLGIVATCAGLASPYTIWRWRRFSAPEVELDVCEVKPGRPVGMKAVYHVEVACGQISARLVLRLVNNEVQAHGHGGHVHAERNELLSIPVGDSGPPKFGSTDLPLQLMATFEVPDAAIEVPKREGFVYRHIEWTLALSLVIDDCERMIWWYRLPAAREAYGRLVLAA